MLPQNPPSPSPHYPPLEGSPTPRAAQPRTHVLTIRSPSLPMLTDFSVVVPPSATVAEVKRRLYADFPLRPPVHAQRIIYAGRLVADTAVVGELCKSNDTLHLVIRNAAAQTAAVPSTNEASARAKLAQPSPASAQQSAPAQVSTASSSSSSSPKPSFPVYFSESNLRQRIVPRPQTQQTSAASVASAAAAAAPLSVSSFASSVTTSPSLSSPELLEKKDTPNSPTPLVSAAKEPSHVASTQTSNTTSSQQEQQQPSDPPAYPPYFTHPMMGGWSIVVLNGQAYAVPPLSAHPGMYMQSAYLSPFSAHTAGPMLPSAAFPPPPFISTTPATPDTAASTGTQMPLSSPYYPHPSFYAAPFSPPLMTPMPSAAQFPMPPMGALNGADNAARAQTEPATEGAGENPPAAANNNARQGFAAGLRAGLAGLFAGGDDDDEDVAFGDGGAENDENGGGVRRRWRRPNPLYLIMRLTLLVYIFGQRASPFRFNLLVAAAVVTFFVQMGIVAWVWNKVARRRGQNNGRAQAQQQQQAQPQAQQPEQQPLLADQNQQEAAANVGQGDVRPEEQQTPAIPTPTATATPTPPRPGVARLALVVVGSFIRSLIPAGEVH